MIFFGFELVGLFIVFDLLGKIGLFIGFMFIVLTSLSRSLQSAIRYFERKKKRKKEKKKKQNKRWSDLFSSNCFGPKELAHIC